MQNWTKLIPSSNIPLTHVSTTFGRSLRGNASYLQILYFYTFAMLKRILGM